MKVNTIEQFKIFKYLEENLELDNMQLELINRNSIKVIDATGDTLVFKYENGKVVY